MIDISCSLSAIIWSDCIIAPDCLCCISPNYNSNSISYVFVVSRVKHFLFFDCRCPNVVPFSSLTPSMAMFKWSIMYTSFHCTKAENTGYIYYVFYTNSLLWNRTSPTSILILTVLYVVNWLKRRLKVGYKINNYTIIVVLCMCVYTAEFFWVLLRLNICQKWKTNPK